MSSDPRVLVIRDTRESGEMLEAALAAGVTSAGGDVFLGGVLPTPAAPLLLGQYGFDLAAVVSASHNPYADNGIKFFAADGFKLSDDHEDAIEERLRGPVAPCTSIGRVRALHGTQEDYLRALEVRFKDLDLSGLDVLLDCAHGATYKVAPEIFRRLGATVTTIGTEPDGRNINDGVGSTHVDALAAQVVSGGHAIGFAFDGDGDRLLAADRKGVVVDGDELIALAVLHLRAVGPARRRGRGHGDDELRLPLGDARGRRRGRDDRRRRPLRARVPARARLGARRRAVRPHHRHGLRALRRRHRERAADARGARGRATSPTATRWRSCPRRS